MEYLTGVKETETKELSALLSGEWEGAQVKVNGTVHTIRDMGEIAFVVLRKREGLLQCVYEEGKTAFDRKSLKEGAAIEVEGILQREERAPGGIEIRMQTVRILSEPSAPMPIQVSKWKLSETLETKLDYRPISVRSLR